MKSVIFTGFILLSFAFAFTACDGGNSNKDNSTTISDKKEQLTTNEMYTCTMHNEVMADKTGECPKCNMKLVKQKMTAEQKKMMDEGTYIKPKQ